MAFWNRKPARYAASITRAEGVVAAAQRFDLNVQGDRDRLAKLQQQWQQDVLVYADTIGELKDAGRFVENSFRRLRLFPAFLRDPEDEPVSVWEATTTPERGDADAGPDENPAANETIPEQWAQRATEIVEGFAARDGGQGALLSRMGVGLFLIGETIIIQRAVMERRPVGDEKPEAVPLVWDWEARSPFELRKSQTNGKVVEIFDSPGAQTGTPILGLDGIPAYVERVWRKHWGWSGWADANTRAAVDTLEELRLLGLIARASLRSRALAGIFTVPEELDFAGASSPEGEPKVTSSPTFARELGEAMIAAITDEADPASVAPTIVRGKAEFLSRDVFGPIIMPSRYGEPERMQREDAVLRLGRTIELPQEKIVGTQDSNHWNAWKVDEDTYQAYIAPLALAVTEGLTYGLLRPLLEVEGCPPEILDRLVVATDASALIRRADRGQLATEGHNRNAVSDDSWRRANGFGDDDAPEQEELLRRLAMSTTLSPEVGRRLLELAGIIAEGAVEPAAPIMAAPEDDEEEVEEPEEGPPARAVAASARRVPVGDRLANIDATLFDRVLATCDMAVGRSLERAGARLRSAGRNTRLSANMRAQISAGSAVPTVGLAAHVGPVVVAAALGDEPVGADDFAELQERFDGWTRAAQEAAIRELASLAGDALTSEQVDELLRRQEEDRTNGWAVLLAALVGFTNGRLMSAVDTDDDGEIDPTGTLRAATIRRALAHAGGGTVEATARGGVETMAGTPVGGVATGPTMQQAFAQAGYPFDGWEWEYGSAARVRPYMPHLSLDGAPSTEWGEQAPGDHGGCRCSAVPIVREAGGLVASTSARTPEWSRLHLPGKHDQRTHAHSGPSVKDGSGFQGLSSAQYEALTPVSSWSQGGRDKAVAAVGSDERGKVLVDTLDKFQDGGSIANVRSKAAKVAHGEEVDPTSKARSEALLGAIGNAPISMAPAEIHRGMSISGSQATVLAKFQVGDTMDLNVTSFTSDRKMAAKFATNTHSAGKTRVMVKVQGDKRALPIQNLTRDRRLFPEKEWVAAGSFRIVDAKKGTAGDVLVTIEQTAVI